MNDDAEREIRDYIQRSVAEVLEPYTHRNVAEGDLEVITAEISKLLAVVPGGVLGFTGITGEIARALGMTVPTEVGDAWELWATGWRMGESTAERNGNISIPLTFEHAEWRGPLTVELRIG